MAEAGEILRKFRRNLVDMIHEFCLDHFWRSSSIAIDFEVAETFSAIVSDGPEKLSIFRARSLVKHDVVFYKTADDLTQAAQFSEDSVV